MALSGNRHQSIVERNNDSQVPVEEITCQQMENSRDNFQIFDNQSSIPMISVEDESTDILNDAIVHDVIIEESINSTLETDGDENGLTNQLVNLQNAIDADPESDYIPSSNNSETDDSENDSDCNNNLETEDNENESPLEDTDAILAENADSHRESNNDDTPPRKKTKYRITREQRYKNKELRMRGQAYNGLRKDELGKYVQTNEIRARILGPTCTADSCKNSKIFFCSIFSDDERKALFEKFWKTLTWDMKRTYISSLVDYIPSKRKKEDSRRSGTLIYHLKKGTEKVRVCKRMFLSTLDVKEWTVRDCSKKLYGIHEAERDIYISKRNRRSNDNRRLTLKSFLDELPKMPSHYCRVSTSKIYLEPTFQSKNDLYREYQKYCDSKNEKVMSLQVLKEEVKKMDIQIFKPRKDQCDLCLSYKLGHIDDLAYQRHQTNKNQSRLSKDTDKELCKNNPKEIAVFTVDMQAVKLAPMLKASAIYYKTKLCVHNYTIYNLYNGQVDCYLWDESQGGLEANIFASLLVDFLENHLLKEPNTKQIIIYSDGCGYQNKNVILSNALLKLAIDRQVTIAQKFFEKGHSQMEVDSVHSTIEKRLKNRDIYLPTDYIAVCREARAKNPYRVKYLQYSDFQDYSKVRFYGSVRPGIRAGDPQVTNVHCFVYLPEGLIQYKLNYTDDYKNLPRRAKVGEYPVTQLYKSQQKIKDEKYNHLQQLKKVLDQQFWQFYDNLPH
ncbi:hypothetical protein NQ317_007204 [Molorchus minor]|uniref:DUF7869 domain-containing protein n=1 Tax=Molorchus minor TaxID=1323400 RepID=A0ABQ9JUP3_9CUCU|nr:hypothetical protein NQ317_007204 [Molorchus minor]